MAEYQFNYYQYKKNLNTKHGFIFSVVFILIILVLGVAVLLKPKPKTLTFYFVEIDTFPTYSKALVLSNSIKQQNGSGYIYYDKHYRVFASFYTTKKDADKVCKNIKELFLNTSVYELKINTNFNFANLSKKQTECVKNLYSSCLNVINFLSNSSILLDAQKLSFNKFILQTNEVFDIALKQCDDFIKLFSTNSTHNVTKEYVSNINANLSKISNYCSEQELDTYLKFDIADMVINFVDFCNMFN